jgi:hypothetical protein
MYPTTHLEWFHNGEWKRIGWDAHDPKSERDLREHGRKMALGGGWYRLTRPSIYAGGPPDVVHEYPVIHPALVP